ncbi:MULTISPECIES: ATP-binding protein [Comamonas]|uniref:ATP-binding protein n=1 Tax=Comamonas TaxID=283 RepID=UPI0012BF77B8|nr:MULTISPECIES: ATP-binding protein [Comamonas]MPS93179.1 hypothetical protein [Comamonas sp.]BDB70590.1 hypothetical protein Cthiooxydans_30020 [Comamonas thiooxydans]
MNKNFPSIIVDYLVLVGHRKNYTIPFSEGLNIIYGDSATGKSSVLECLNYLFGSSKLNFDDEIEAAVKHVMMQVNLNGFTYVVKRDIFNVKAAVEVYPSSLDSMGDIFPKRYSPNYVDEGPDGYFSDFLLTALGMPIVLMRQAPTKSDSASIRLSFRDVFKYCYLKQDDVGSKALLGEGSFAGVKNKETFKYLFNLLDSTLSDLQRDLAEAIGERKSLEATYKAVSDFLRTVEFKDEYSLDDLKKESNQRRKLAKDELNRLNSEIVSSNESYSVLKEILQTMALRISDMDHEIQEAEQAIEKFSRLKNDYQADLSKLKSIKKSRELIGSPKVMFSCPLCSSSVDLGGIKKIHEIEDGDNISQEQNSISRRIKDLEQLIFRERSRRERSQSDLKLLEAERNNARRMLDEEMASAVTPYLAERDSWAYEAAKAEEEYKYIERNIKIRNQQKSIFSDLEKSQDRIIILESKIEEVKKKAPSIVEIINDLGDLLSQYLRVVQINDIRDVSIGNTTFLPVLRNRNYRDTTSGGLRTILSIGHYLGILRLSLDKSSNHPKFLMIDTVGKYLGKTNSKYDETDIGEDRKEGVSDPKKYANLYKSMLLLTEYAVKKEQPIQIIVVDNDIPSEVQASNPSSIAAYFNSEGLNGSSRGLIDDAHIS